MKIRLIYGEKPFWRAEVGRIALKFGDIKFDDVRLSREEFLRVKKAGKLDDGTKVPFRQLPCLNVDGQSICQTGGIARFCGKLGGLYPREHLVDAARIDQVIDMATDINVLLEPSVFEKDNERKREMREELVDGILKRKIGFLEELLNGNSWFVGESISVADIAIWRLMGWLTSGIIDYIPVALLSDFPNLKRVCLNTGNQGKIKDWVEKTYPKNYNLGSFE